MGSTAGYRSLDLGRNSVTVTRNPANSNLLAAARNEYAAETMGPMHGLSRRFWYRHHRRVADLPLAARRHAELDEAIAAAEASDRLMDYIETITRAALDA